MTRSRWRILLVPLLLLVIGGLLASAQGGATCADGKKTDEELLQIATHDLVSELREAAAIVMAQRLQRSPLPPLAQLEELARSPSPELRGEVLPLLVDSYAQALDRRRLTVDELIAEILQGETEELQLARAMAAIDYLFEQICSLDPDLFRRIERLLGGSEEELCGYRFDGSLEEVRAAVFVALIPRITDPPELHSCEEWRAIAVEGQTSELRFLAAMVYIFYYPCLHVLADPDTLGELAIEGESFELRFEAALAYVTRHFDFDNLDELIDLAVNGESEELRYAIAGFLAFALLASDVSDTDLFELATMGETLQLRWAASWALGERWAERSSAGKLQIEDIPRQSEAEAYSLEQALIIFAAENTEAYPELAQAAIRPLTVIWKGYEER